MYFCCEENKNSHFLLDTMMWGHKFWFLLLSHFLLSDLAHSQALPPPRFKNRIGSDIFSIIPPSSSPISLEEARAIRDEEPHSDPIQHLVSGLTASLHGLVHLHENLSCAELEAGPWKGAGFSHELLGLIMVPVLVSAGCEPEAEELVKNLIMMLGWEDTRELLAHIVGLMSRSSLHRSNSVSIPSKPSGHSGHHLQALMFNIQQLAEDEDVPSLEKRCQGWMRMKDMVLLGRKLDHVKMRLSEAKHVCQNLGFVCAGVTKEDPTSPKLYHIILRPGSWLMPSSPPNQSESWIQSCRVLPVRWRRHTAHQTDCTNEKEERVYKVVEWIPAVSTLYNLGTAVYYASMSCSDTAKERALMSTVDLGTDAIVAATGGTAGIAGYALGAGIKTSIKAGVRYLLNRMNQEEDLLMNQNSWEDGTIIFQ